MELNEYQALAMRTAKVMYGNDNLIHATLGFTSEAGELATAVKAYVIYGKPLNVDNVVEEIGDAMWYLALMANSLNIPLGDIAKVNIDKLRIRFPEKYTDEAAIARADKAGEA